MVLNDHAGPKGQIFVRGRAGPVWFSSIKQVFAYTMLPEEPKGLLAVYVNDMATAGADGAPDPAVWIDARQAYYVIEGGYIGGMGAEDAMPFSDQARAQDFAAATAAAWPPSARCPSATSSRNSAVAPPHRINPSRQQTLASRVISSPTSRPAS